MRFEAQAVEQRGIAPAARGPAAERKANDHDDHSIRAA